MRQKSLENLTHTGVTEGWVSRGKEQVTYFINLNEWMTEQG